MAQHSDGHEWRAVVRDGVEKGHGEDVLFYCTQCSMVESLRERLNRANGRHYLSRGVIDLTTRYGLTLTEARILSVLMAHEGEVVTAERIAELLWPDTPVLDRYARAAIRQHVYQVREKFKLTGGYVIETIGRIGHRFVRAELGQSLEAK